MPRPRQWVLVSEAKGGVFASSSIESSSPNAQREWALFHALVIRMRYQTGNVRGPVVCALKRSQAEPFGVEEAYCPAYCPEGASVSQGQCNVSFRRCRVPGAWPFDSICEEAAGGRLRQSHATRELCVVRGGTLTQK